MRRYQLAAILEQADGTAWMALYSQNMLEIAIELAKTDPEYVDMVLKFIEHFVWIASSMVHLGSDTGMWDEEDGFFYDVLRLPNGQAERLKVRSMVGLLPLCAVTMFDGTMIAKYPEVASDSSGSSKRVRNSDGDPRPDETRRFRPPARFHSGRDQAASGSSPRC